MVLWDQHLLKAEEAEAEDTLRTLEAARRGFLPFVMRDFLEKYMQIRAEHEEKCRKRQGEKLNAGRRP